MGWQWEQCYLTIVKALANGFNICFNILSILLNGNVESVCHPLSAVLKRVEAKLNRCLKSLKAFKLCFNIRSTFLLFSGMFGMVKRSWSRLPCSFNIVEQAHAQLRKRNHGHHGCKDGSNAKQFCVAVVHPSDGISISWSYNGGLSYTRRFGEEINTAARKRKALEADKTKKPKWKSGEIDTLIDELEKRSCLWDVFDKDYHNRGEVAYTELEDILKHTKKDIKTKIAGLRTQLGREIAKTNSWKSGPATSEKYGCSTINYNFFVQ